MGKAETDIIREIIVPSGCETITGRLLGIGNPDLVNRHKIGLLCSIQCPGDIILKTLDLITSIRDADCCVVSGFHSPMEQECLKIFLRGTCGIVFCHARSLPARIPEGFKKPIADGRLLLLSPFGETQSHATRKTSRLRNRLVAALGDIVVIPYASPSGMTEAIFQEVAGSGKPVFTFQGECGSTLRVVDDKAMLLTGAATILQGLSSVRSAKSAKSKHTTQSTSANARDRKYCLSDIRRTHSRAYEKWTDEEEARLIEFCGAGKTRREIAQELQRQPSAISSRLRKLGF